MCEDWPWNTAEQNQWAMCTLHHGIQYSMEAILACHPALSTGWVGWLANRVNYDMFAPAPLIRSVVYLVSSASLYCKHHHRVANRRVPSRDDAFHSVLPCGCLCILLVPYWFNSRSLIDCISCWRIICVETSRKKVLDKKKLFCVEFIVVVTMTPFPDFFVF